MPRRRAHAGSAVADADLLGALDGTASNDLYRANLAKGQTGLSIAFDLPTQTGYDPDSPMATRRGRQGRRAGEPISGTCARCSTASRPAQMNTSMTINATAAWLLALYVANAEEQGVAAEDAARHDAERHRQGVPVARHVHLPAGAVAPADRRHGRLVRPARAEVEPDQRLLATTCRRRARRRCRRSPTRWRRRSGCSTRCATRARSRRSGSVRCSARSPSSSTPGSGSSRRSASCGR